MAKISLASVLSGFNLNKINENFAKIEDALNNSVMYRKNIVGEDNTLQTDLDANGKTFYNLPAPSADHHAARLKDVKNAIAGLAGVTANLINFSPNGYVLSTNVQGALEEIGSYTPVGTGGATRSNKSKFSDFLSVKDFGAKGDGTTDDTAAIQAAINSANVFATTIYFPPGAYKITSPLKTVLSGTRFLGSSRYGTYIITPAGSTFDMLRIAHQQTEVSHFIWRPSGNQYCIRVYAGRAHIHDNYALASANNLGVWLLLVDTDPDTGTFKPGAYVHSIHDNIVGDAGFAFESAIYDNSTQGITASLFSRNIILSNRPIQINIGGGNTYIGNLLQSSSGVAGSTVGVGLTFGTGVVGEKVFGNYIELFQAMIETKRTDATYQIFYAVGNHNDACATTVADAGAKNYVFEDAAGKVINYNGWTTGYSNTAWSITKSGKTSYAADANGNCFLGGPSSGTSHIINRNSSTEGTVILNFQYNGTSMGYMQDARGTPINGASAALSLNKNTTSGRSINAVGTVVTGGLDYAEYMYKSDTCGEVAKGQIVGITADEKITDKWIDAVAFAVKSTDPSYVGGDTWAYHLGAFPVDGTEEEQEEYRGKLEDARKTVDRIAFCGRVPANVLGASPGQYIIPVKDGEGIKGMAVTSPTFEEYMLAVGRVIAIEDDGRARIIVKVS